MRSRALTALGAALAAALLTGSAAAVPGRVLPALVPPPSDGLTRALESGSLTEAEYALERARALFAPARVAARYGPLARSDPRDATLVLRDLALRLDLLPVSRRAEAARVLARPDHARGDPLGHAYQVESRVDCTEHVCFHWVDTSSDAPPSGDSDGDTIPDFVELVESVVEEVWATEIDAYGYRAPNSDLTSENHGPDGRLDVYLADVGADGLYGYCTSDDPNLGSSSYPYSDFSAYCVLENDFSPTQFPGPTTPEQGLEVTAAHEFFHAVQFAYDAFEDAWLMEGTAVWMEDQVYGDVKDNLQYLTTSALSRPAVPLDTSSSSYSSGLSGFPYGSFVFWQFLSEDLGDPSVIRRIWELAGDTRDLPDEYSLEATATMLEERGSSLRTAFAAFGAVNAFPAAFYAGGAAYPVPPRKIERTLSRRRPTVSGHPRLSHLTTWYGAFEPARSLPAKARLVLTLDLPLGQAAAATLVVRLTSGSLRRLPVTVPRRGDARVSVQFNPARVDSVTLVLTNASSRFSCWRHTDLSCQGRPLDDHLEYRYQAQVTRATPSTGRRG